MEQYNKVIAPNPKFELIHVSYDKDEAAAVAWARKENFPWPTVPSSKVEASGLGAYAGDFVPDYVLLDKDGQVLVKGKKEAFQKLAALNN
ncbi:MAG: hypothetical protein HKN82_17825 [Akkermansiaceae bacterium]|nr:hypothetical protein [Akkermansiaceae bacterium]NNM28770.1 hypothetical protein [Akkermansiaceae bacterium]